MSKFSIAGCQVDWRAGNNLANMQKEVARIKQTYPWLDMAVFGELAVFGPDINLAQTIDGEADSVFREIARKNKIWLLPGSLFEKRGKDIYNTCRVYRPDGSVAVQYSKIYPWQPFEKNVKGGDKCVVFDVEGVGRIGLSICYDMWFPETIRTLTWMGAELILHPTMTYSTDRDVELSMVRASAAQNQCVFFDVNTGGGHLGCGRSIVAGPGGDVLHQAGDAREIFPIVVDFDQIRHAREYGSNGLSQVLKSFRDMNVKYPPYQDGALKGSYYETLGPLKMPTSMRKSKD